MKPKSNTTICQEFVDLEAKFRGFIISVANKFGSVSAPFGTEDYIQVGRLGLWKLLKKDDLGNVYSDRIIKLAIRSDMSDFHKSNVKRMNNKHDAYKAAYIRINS